MKISSSLPVVFALLLGMSATARADGPAEDAERSVIAVIDAARVEAGVPPLRRDANLDDAALMHAEDMAEHGFVGHESETTGDPIARVQSVGFPSARVGENVARAGSPGEAANRMFASQPHREQMVAADFTDVGVAVVEGTDGFYVVQVFASRAAPEIPPPHAADVPRPVAAPQAPVAAPEVVEAAEASLESAEAPVEAEAPLAEPMPVEESTEAAQAAPFYPQANAPTYPSAQGAPPTVVLQVVPAANVQGYWVQHGGAWWFYAVPAGARPGTVLSAVPGGQGPGNVGTNQLPVSAQAAVNGSPAQHYVAQPYGAQPYAAQPYAAQPYAARPVVVQPYVAQPYAVRPHYVAPRPSARVVVRSAVGNRRGIFSLGLLRSPRRHY